MTRRRSRVNRRYKYPDELPYNIRRTYRGPKPYHLPAEPVLETNKPVGRPRRNRIRPRDALYPMGTVRNWFNESLGLSQRDRRCRTYHDNKRKSRKTGGRGAYRLTLGQLKFIVNDRRKC